MTLSLAGGLSDDEVAARVAQGKTNDVPTRAARSVSEIVRGNVFTRINAILGVLLIIVLSTGSVINGAFGLLIVANSAIGIIQELRDRITARAFPAEMILETRVEDGPLDDGDVPTLSGHAGNDAPTSSGHIPLDTPEAEAPAAAAKKPRRWDAAVRRAAVAPRACAAAVGSEPARAWNTGR